MPTAPNPHLPAGSRPSFDAYCIVDWSSSSVPKLGADSIWLAVFRREGHRSFVETLNCRTRQTLEEELTTRLRGPLARRRVLVGFDFPLGYPRGFAAALGYRGPRERCWMTIWRTLSELVRDGEDNTNNRFEVAAELNERVSGGFGPFFGRKARVSSQVAAHLSPKQRGSFEYPLQAASGASLAKFREVDTRGKTASTAWFVYGGANSVGGQALVGIPRVARLREAFPDSRVWPFETGARLPTRREARLVLAEVYPTLFHRRQDDGRVNDREQVVATARALAARDADGTLAQLFAAPGNDEAVLHEEGWILGVT